MLRVILFCAFTLASTWIFAWQSGGAVENDSVRKVAVSRDTWLSSVDKERLGSNGGASRLKLKSYQEMSIVDFDSTALKGRVIEKAYLHLNAVDKKPLLRLSTSSISAEWYEGDATGYGQESGASTFQFRKFPTEPWSYPGSDLTSVILGSGNSWWGSYEPTQIDDKGWQKVEVSRDVIAARIVGLSQGVLIFDDVGSEWKRTGDKFEVFSFPNRYIYSRQQNASVAPYFTFELGAEDRLAPAAATELTFDNAKLPAGESIVRWRTPADQGPAGTLGFEVTIDGKRVPLYLVPQAGESGQLVEMRVRDLSLDPTKEHKMTVVAIDRAGNVGPAAQLKFEVSSQTIWKPESSFAASRKEHNVPSSTNVSGAWSRIGNTEFAVIDELDKLNLLNGTLIPSRPGGYWVDNHLWSAARNELRLSGAKKEWLAFQFVLRGAETRGLSAKFAFENSKLEIPIQVGRYAPIAQGDGLFGDPIVPLARWGNGKAFGNDKAQYGCFHLEFHLPGSMPPGVHKGKLTIVLEGQKEAALEVKTELTVWDMEIPDSLSFLPEMNCYGLPQNEIDYYRLAHRHRTVLNRLPYYHNGRVADGCAPALSGDKMDWTQWDKRFSPLLTGEAFADLERNGEPVECFYLPLFENWPIPIEPNYKESYWADEALSEAYRTQFEQVSKGIAQHVKENKWDKTIFHFYLNGKNNFKERGWSRSTSPWILDEPSHFQDFDALRWFGEAFQNGTKEIGAKNVLFRTDVSRPEWQRGVLDGLVGYAVVSSAVRQYQRHVLDRAAKNGEWVVEYGTSNRLDESNIQPEAWCVDAWSMGLQGVLPWQTIGTAESWKSGDELALFYPDPESNAAAPIPSIRLKAYRRGQQDVEYLELLRRRSDMPPWMLGNWLRDVMDWTSVREGTAVQGGEDAGRVKYRELKSEDFAHLRSFVARAYQGTANSSRK